MSIWIIITYCYTMIDWDDGETPSWEEHTHRNTFIWPCWQSIHSFVSFPFFHRTYQIHWGGRSFLVDFLWCLKNWLSARNNCHHTVVCYCNSHWEWFPIRKKIQHQDNASRILTIRFTTGRNKTAIMQKKSIWTRHVYPFLHQSLFSDTVFYLASILEFSQRIWFGKCVARRKWTKCENHQDSKYKENVKPIPIRKVKYSNVKWYDMGTLYLCRKISFLQTNLC